MPPSFKIGRKHLSRIGGRWFPDLSEPSCPGTVVPAVQGQSLQPVPAFHRISHRISTWSATAIPVSKIQKGNSKYSISPLHQVLSASERGRARLDRVLLRFNPAVQGEEGKKNQEMANWPFLIREANSLYSSVLYTSIIIPESLK